MITSVQFDAALKTISDYKIQLENKLIIERRERKFKIDIQKSIKINLFNVLRNYYNDEYNLVLRWDDLKVMDIKLLKEIDFNKLRRYRGFGAISANKFRKILVYHLILEPEYY